MRRSGTVRAIRRWRAYAALACLLLLCTSWVVADSLFGFSEPQPIRVSLPDFRGMQVDAMPVEEWMRIEYEYRHDEQIPEGRVLAQSPPAGERRLPSDGSGCRVLLTVSLGRRTVILPSLVGMDARQAEAELRALGLAVEWRRVMGDGVRDRVLATEPTGGEELPLGGLVTLTVSETASAREVRMPELIGLSRSDALLALWRAGLGVGTVGERETDDPALVGSVVAQSRVAGTLIAAGTRIDFWVATDATE